MTTTYLLARYYTSSGYQKSNSLFGGGGGKAFGLGAGAGFLGGAVAAGGAMSVYHRYQMYKAMMHYRGYGYGGGYGASGYGYGGGYGGSGYGYGFGHSPYGHRTLVVNHNSCIGGCPNQAFCDYGICRCREGFEARFGRCYENFNNVYNTNREEFNRRLGSGFDPYKPCQTNPECRVIDMNMICSPQQKCACRNDMKWNADTGECQIYMDVDCSNVDVNKKEGVAAAVSDVPEMSGSSPPLANTTNMEQQPAEIDEAVEFVEGKEITDLTANDTLKDSGLARLDINKTSEAELKSEFCSEVSQIAGRYQRQTSYEVTRRQLPRGGGISIGAVVAIAFVVLLCCCCLGKKAKEKVSERRSGRARRGSGSSKCTRSTG